MDEMRERTLAAAKKHRTLCGDFLRELIAIPSASREEETIALRVREEMVKLGYDEVNIDRFGNVIGRIGDGRMRLVLDGHMDTSAVGDRSTWRFDPYNGETKAGKIYGHGAANNKAGLAAIIHGAGIIKELDLAADATIYVVGSIQAQECEGLAYKALFDIEKLQPHYVVLSAPTGLRIHRGHRGRAEIRITLRGQPVTAADPDKGFNAIYGIAQIISKIEALNGKLGSDKFLGKATIAVTHVECDRVGAGQLPEACRLIVDRRLLPNETPKKILAEIKEVTKGTRAKVEFIEYDSASYRGLRVPMDKYFPTWQLPEDHPLIESAEAAFRSLYKKKIVIDKWVTATAGSYTMGVAGIPTIGFGPSEESFSTPINDHARIDEIEKAMAFYASLPTYLPDPELID